MGSRLKEAAENATAHGIVTYLIGIGLAALAWFTSSWAAEVKDDIKTLTATVAALSTDVRVMSQRVDGDGRAQALVDAGQDRLIAQHDNRIGRLEDAADFR